MERMHVIQIKIHKETFDLGYLRGFTSTKEKDMQHYTKI
jgi:hypothetical protein